VRDFLAESPVIVQRELLAPGEESTRVDGASGAVIEGRYHTIEIRGSTALLRNVSARSIRILRSDVVIEDSRLVSDAIALEASESKVELTSVDFEAKVAIETEASRIDLAGVDIAATEAALRAKRRASSLVFSVSRLKSPRTNGYRHGTQRLSSGEEL
jgi:hypothetical protein